MEQPVYIVDVLRLVGSVMKVPKFPVAIPTENFVINVDFGSPYQILEQLISKENSSFDKFKYPLLAFVMPIPEKNESGFIEVSFPRIVFAYLTKTGTNTELVLDKYSSDGVIKNILYPMVKEFIRNLAFSTFTLMGDPDMYAYTATVYASQQPIGKGLNDFVDIIELTNLKATFFSTIKFC